jgi:hypothetical protein
MTSPIVMLRDAIIHEDWELVKDAYHVLTGEVLVTQEEQPTKSKAKPAKTAKKAVKKERAKKQGDFTISTEALKSYRGPVAIRNRPNQFDHDAFSKVKDADMAKAAKIDSSTEFIPAERNREEARKVKMKCSKCKKTYSVYETSVILVRVERGDEPEWLCNNCSCGPRG